MTTSKQTHFDAIVIGVGFAGIYMLHKLRNELGLSVRAFDRAGGVGGTWYWNRYPGAAADVDSYMYRYSFDRELLQEFDWKTRYEPQPSILAYLNKVVDKHDLRRDIQLNTSIESLVFDEERDQWTARTDSGEEVTARWVVSSLGPLSARNLPEVEGLDTFAGRVAHTGAWPEDLDITGKRVGVVGTGSTGTQFICAAAPMAEHLTVFQRSAQYVIPSGDGPVSEERLAEIRKNYDKIWDEAFNSRLACGFRESEVAAMSVSPEERERVFEEGWQAGNGFHFMFGLFVDLIFDPAANQAATDFIKRKIKQIVRDPETARKLTPTDYFAKRPICNTDYYETFNRDNVSLVSLKETPITRVTPTGVVTADGTEHELDVLVFATGFEAMDGSYNRMHIQGRAGETLKEHWADQPVSYLGIAVSGFPNLFMVFGPNSAFSNLPPGLETQIEWIADFIRTAEERGIRRVEATTAAEQEWSTMCRDMALQSLFAQTDSWIFGTNIPGKHQRSMFFFGGIATYRQTLRDIVEGGYTGFTLEGQPSLTPA